MRRLRRAGARRHDIGVTSFSKNQSEKSERFAVCNPNRKNWICSERSYVLGLLSCSRLRRAAVSAVAGGLHLIAAAHRWDGRTGRTRNSYETSQIKRICPTPTRALHLSAGLGPMHWPRRTGHALPLVRGHAPTPTGTAIMCTRKTKRSICDDMK